MVEEPVKIYQLQIACRHYLTKSETIFYNPNLSIINILNSPVIQTSCSLSIGYDSYSCWLFLNSAPEIQLIDAITSD